MAYRKTETIIATQDAMRRAIVYATRDVIALRGVEAVTVDAVAKLARCSVGLLYKHFANKDELIAAATAWQLADDLAAMREASIGADGIEALARALAAFYNRLKRPRMVKAMLDQPLYRDGVRDELSRLIKGVSALPQEEQKMAADAMLGALHGIFRASDGILQTNRAAAFALRIAGVSSGAANKALSRYSIAE